MKLSIHIVCISLLFSAGIIYAQIENPINIKDPSFIEPTYPAQLNKEQRGILSGLMSPPEDILKYNKYLTEQGLPQLATWEELLITEGANDTIKNVSKGARLIILSHHHIVNFDLSLGVIRTHWLNAGEEMTMRSGYGGPCYFVWPKQKVQRHDKDKH
jgi:hypothetical protein